jgi:hypothetical protein
MVLKVRFKCDGTRAETRFRLSAKRTSPFKSAGGVSSVDCRQLELCASAIVMLDTPRSDVVCKSTGYPLHSSVFSSVLLLCVIVCHHISTELYRSQLETLVLRLHVQSGVRNTEHHAIVRSLLLISLPVGFG